MRKENTDSYNVELARDSLNKAVNESKNPVKRKAPETYPAKGE